MSREVPETESLARFRDEVRDFIAKTRPPRPAFKLPQTFLEVESQAQFEYLRAWQATVFDAGYLGFDVPEQYGGRGVDPEKKRIVEHELTRAGAPFFVNFLALTWVVPTILAFGTEEQKKRMLRPLLRADEIWCQGFSEPGAGSDLVALQTAAVRDGDNWIINGSKVWTSLGALASWMLLLACTDKHDKYNGITYFLVPMQQPGVTVRPIHKMTGECGFNEVFLEDVIVPDHLRVDEVGAGWKVPMSTLTSESGATA